MDFRSQWPKVDEDLFKSMIKLNNEIVIGEKNEEEFEKFIFKNKEKINNPDYLQIFAEIMKPEKEYFEKYKDMCQFFYNFMKNNPDWKKLNFSLRTSLRLELFEYLFERYLNHVNPKM